MKLQYFNSSVVTELSIHLMTKDHKVPPT